jgi:predicted regulator of Ras-like GTPase activity (Roadblock/LC7/MglB family)
MRYLFLQVRVIFLSFLVFSGGIASSAEELMGTGTIIAPIDLFDHLDTDSAKKWFSPNCSTYLGDKEEREILLTIPGEERGRFRVSLRKESYLIEKGDTLKDISKEFYGSPRKHMLISRDNPGQIKDPDLIYAGKTIDIFIANVNRVEEKAGGSVGYIPPWLIKTFIFPGDAVIFLMGIAFVLSLAIVINRRKKVPPNNDGWTSKIKKILNSLQKKDYIQEVVLLDRDGLVMISTFKKGEKWDEDAVAAMTAGILEVGERSVKEMKCGNFIDILITGKKGTILVKEVGKVAILSVIASPEVNQTKLRKRVNAAIAAIIPLIDRAEES